MSEGQTDEQAVQAIIDAFESNHFRGVNMYPSITKHNITTFNSEKLINACIKNYNIPKMTQFLTYLQQKLIQYNSYGQMERFTMLMIDNRIHELFLKNIEYYKSWEPIIHNMLDILSGQAYILTGNNNGVPIILYLLKYDQNFFKLFVKNNIKIKEENYVFILCFYDKFSFNIQLDILKVLQIDSVNNRHLLQIYQQLLLKSNILALNTDNQIIELFQHYKYISKNGDQLGVPQNVIIYIENQLTLECFIQIFKRKTTISIILESLIAVNKYQMNSLFNYLAEHNLIATTLQMFNVSSFDIKYKIILIINYLYIRCKQQFIAYIEDNKDIQLYLKKAFVKRETFNIYQCINIENIYEIIERQPDIIKQYQLVANHHDTSNGQYDIQVLVQQDYFNSQKSRKHFLLPESLEILNIKSDQLQEIQDIFKINIDFNKILEQQNIQENQFLHMLYQINGMQSKLPLVFQFKLIKNFEIAHRVIYNILLTTNLIKKQFSIQKLSLKNIFYPKIDESGEQNMNILIKRCLQDQQMFQNVWNYIKVIVRQDNQVKISTSSFLKRSTNGIKPQNKESQVQLLNNPNKFTVKQLISFVQKYLQQDEQNYLQIKDLIQIDKQVECQQIKEHVYTQLSSSFKIGQLYNDINQIRLQSLKEYGKQTSYSPYNQNQKLIENLENDIIIATELVHLIFNYLCFYLGLRGHLNNLRSYVPKSFTITDFNEVIYCENTSTQREQDFIRLQNFYSIMCAVKLFRYQIDDRITIEQMFIMMHLVQYVIEFESQTFNDDYIEYKNPVLNYKRDYSVKKLLQTWSVINDDVEIQDELPQQLLDTDFVYFSTLSEKQ